MDFRSDLTWRLQVRAELHSLGHLRGKNGNVHEVAAELQWDVSKVFDSAQQEKLVGLAIHFNYTLAFLHMALNAYSWE